LINKIDFHLDEFKQLEDIYLHTISNYNCNLFLIFLVSGNLKLSEYKKNLDDMEIYISEEENGLI
jgi:hypothetical protein